MFYAWVLDEASSKERLVFLYMFTKGEARSFLWFYCGQVVLVCQEVGSECLVVDEPYTYRGLVTDLWK